jgi:hypothetical protein
MRPLLLASAVFFSVSSAQAVTLVVGVNPLPGTTVAAEPQLAGTVVVDELQAFSLAGGAGTLSGTVQNRVVLSVDGTYDFYWRIRDTSFTPGTAGGTFGVGSLRIANFGAALFGANGNFRTDGLGTLGPDNALVFGDPTGLVNFRFSGAGLAGGDESLFFFLDTNARAFAKTAVYDLTDNGLGPITGTFATFAPAAVPEPAGWALMITGLAAAGAALRRRTRVKVSYA